MTKLPDPVRVISAARAIVVDAQNRVLLIRRSDNRHWLSPMRPHHAGCVRGTAAHGSDPRIATAIDSDWQLNASSVLFAEQV